MQLTYAQLEDFFAEVHKVAPEKRIALKGRLKHFQRLGWPLGTNLGKGARVQYGLGQTLSLAIGMEMLQLGLTPEKVRDQMRYAHYIADGFLSAFKNRGSEADQVLYIFSPESLYSLRGDVEEQQGIQSLLIAQSKMSDLYRIRPFFGQPRYAVINISALMEIAFAYFTENNLANEEEISSALTNWKLVSKKQARSAGWIVSDDDGDT